MTNTAKILNFGRGNFTGQERIWLKEGVIKA